MIDLDAQLVQRLLERLRTTRRTVFGPLDDAEILQLKGVTADSGAKPSIALAGLLALTIRCREVLRFGSKSTPELSAGVDLTPQAVLYWIHKLEADGVVESTERSRISPKNRWRLVANGDGR